MAPAAVVKKFWCKNVMALFGGRCLPSVKYHVMFGVLWSAGLNVGFVVRCWPFLCFRN